MYLVVCVLTRITLHKVTGESQDLKINPDSCLSDLADWLISLDAPTILLHLGKSSIFQGANKQVISEVSHIKTNLHMYVNFFSFTGLELILLWKIFFGSGE